MRIFIFSLICALTASLSAQPEFTAQSISIFKDGSAFYLKSAQVTPKAGSLQIPVKDLPQAAFGTLWFSSKTGDLQSISSYTQETTETKKDTTRVFPHKTHEILQSNVGKKVKIYLDFENFESGVLQHSSEGNITLKTDSEWLSIPEEAIHHISFLQAPILADTFRIKEVKTKKKERIVDLGFKKSTTKQELELMYVQRDLGWLPTYKINLISDTRAELELRALMVNDAEDILNTNIQFVVGVPNFMYGMHRSPFVENGSVEDFLRRIQNPGNDAFRADLANRAQTISYGIENLNTDEIEDEGSGMAGIADEDLYFYQQKNVSLKKGGRAYFNILSAEVPIQHIYEVKLEANNNNQRYSSNFSFDENYKNKVWHSIKLTNSTIHPWTTGSAMVTKKLDKGLVKAISQDKLKYTPIKGETFLKITIAPDVSVRDSEKEIDREKKKTQVQGYWYDLVTVEGKIKLRNYKTKAIDLNVKRHLTGNIEKSSPDWLVAQKVSLNGQLNDVQEICWETSLKAGEKMEITYTYKLYVRQ